MGARRGARGASRAVPPLLRRTFAARSSCACLCCALVARVANALIPPEQVRREQLTATQAAFSRFSADGIGGTIERQDLPNFLRYVVTSMSTSALPQAELSARSSELTQQLLGHLPPQAVQLSVSDIMQAAEKVLFTPPTCSRLRPVHASDLNRRRAAERAWKYGLEAAAPATQKARAQSLDHAPI